MTLEPARALLTPEGMALLRSLPPYRSADDTLALSTRLRREGHSPELIAAALTQSRLRAEASAKFGPFAEHLLYTADGLQQATRLTVAAAHASRLQRAGITHFADLGCGLGTDSLGFAAAGMSGLAVDADELTAALATFNLADWPVEVRHQRAEDVTLPADWGVFLDPARRVAGRRTWRPEEFTPSLDWVFDLTARRTAGVKLGPGLPHELIPAAAEAEWVSDCGEVVEVGLWFGDAAERPGQTSALRHDADGWHRVVAEQDDPQPGPVGAWLYEPDGAAIRARALGTLAAQHSLHTIDPHIAYLTGDDRVDSPFLRRYQVLEQLPFDRRALLKSLRAHGARRVTVKKRGADIDPAALAKQLRKQLAKSRDAEASAQGADDLTVFVTRVGDRHCAILTKTA